MTPKEKAKYLVSRFIESDNMIFNIEGAKECALIVIDETIKVCEDQLSAFDFKFVSYWQEVKQEIEKL
jgi:hypothetical protein